MPYLASTYVNIPHLLHHASIYFTNRSQLQNQQPQQSNMSNKKIIAIIGATGAQGGSVINAILNDSSNNFAVRAITRDSTKPNAQKLQERGCEVVEADLSNKDSLQKAFEHAYGVFGVTDFWATMNPDIEISQGKNIADAAKVCSFPFVVYPSLPSPLQTKTHRFSIALTALSRPQG